VGAFGPIDLLSGTLRETPKQAWRGAEVLAIVRERARVPVGLETDVGAAALGENRLGAARGLSDCVYLTVGTGIGGGAIVGGAIVHGTGHPEMGHVRVPRHARDIEAGFKGVCGYHPDGCLEGLASGPAVAARHGAPAEELASDHEAWEIESHYLAHAVANLIVTLRPQRIIVGGGVMAADGLRQRVQRRLAALVNPHYVDIGDGSDYVTAPGLGRLSGVTGAILLAEQALNGG
jgi:fructokinase